MEQFDIQKNINNICAALPQGVRLIAVSKTKPVSDVQMAYDAGQRLFGENHALEMRDKHAQLPSDIAWHFIGHLQRNKVKYIVPFVNLIHSIDSLSLLEVVDREATKHDRTVDCLLQFHIATEETKFGLDLDEATALLDSQTYRQMRHIRLRGVMGMATNTPDRELIRREFASLRDIFTTLRNSYFCDQPQFNELSMGMSSDYSIAIEEGATLIRVGSAIFGARNYAV